MSARSQDSLYYVPSENISRIGLVEIKRKQNLDTQICLTIY